MQAMLSEQRLVFRISVSAFFLSVGSALASCPSPLFSCVPPGNGGGEPTPPPGGTLFVLEPNKNKTNKALDILISEEPSIVRAKSADKTRIRDLIGDEIKRIDPNKTYYFVPSIRKESGEGFVFKGSELR